MRDRLIQALYRMDNGVDPEDMDQARLIYGSRVDILLAVIEEEPEPGVYRFRSTSV